MPAQLPHLARRATSGDSGNVLQAGLPLDKFLTASPPSWTLTSSGQLVLLGSHHGSGKAAEQLSAARRGGHSPVLPGPKERLRSRNSRRRGPGHPWRSPRHLVAEAWLRNTGAAGPDLVVPAAARFLGSPAQVRAQGRKPGLRETAACGCAGRTVTGRPEPRSVAHQGLPRPA
jgi:hypothetical protein